MIEVASAVIVREHRLLLTQRRGDKPFPFTWECPGGKVEGNESHHQGLARELLEELGIIAPQFANTPMWSGRLATPGAGEGRAEIFLLFYRTLFAQELERLEPPAVVPLEGQGIGWFAADEVERLTLAPGNVAASERLLACLR